MCQSHLALFCPGFRFIVCQNVSSTLCSFSQFKKEMIRMKTFRTRDSPLLECKEETIPVILHFQPEGLGNFNRNAAESLRSLSPALWGMVTRLPWDEPARAPLPLSETLWLESGRQKCKSKRQRKLLTFSYRYTPGITRLALWTVHCSLSYVPVGSLRAVKRNEL